MLILFLQFWYEKIPPVIFQRYRSILEVHSPYFRALKEPLKKRFLIRLHILLHFTTFIPNSMPAVRLEMCVIIGSGIIQVTFGLKRFVLKHFNKIYIVPRRYNLIGFQGDLLGHVDLHAKVMVLSWQDVQTGFHIADDAINVALHEIAHCIEAENKFRFIFQEFFSRVKYSRWKKEAFRKLEIMRRDEHQFLKDYGKQNRHELFAVCIEAFFEQPNEFKEELPLLYSTLADLLHQDPTDAACPIR